MLNMFIYSIFVTKKFGYLLLFRYFCTVERQKSSLKDENI